MKTLIDVTPEAVSQIRDQLDKAETPYAGVRFGIRGGGCTGFSYVFEFAETSQVLDQVLDLGQEVKMFVDPKSVQYVKGTVIHFEVGMRGHGFKFRNPNVKDSCGCGESINF